MTDNLRPKGTVQVECSCGCRWAFWVEPLDPRLPDGPFYFEGCGPDCKSGCEGVLLDQPTEKAE